MATKKTTQVEETVEVEELSVKQVIGEGIARVIEATGIDVQKNRYKAMRAIAFEAFAQHIESGTFDALVDAAIANIDELPAGWEIERTAKAEVAKPAPKAKATAKPAAKPAAKKTPAKAPASGRKRPQR
jgi:hypothetical protein